MAVRPEQRDLIWEYVQNCMDFNADKGIITAVREAGEFLDIPMTEQEVEAIAFQMLQELNP